MAAKYLLFLKKELTITPPHIYNIANVSFEMLREGYVFTPQTSAFFCFKNSNNEYIIVAGAFDGTEDFALYRWTGLATDAPLRYTNADLSGLNPEGIVEVPNSLPTGVSIELISDHGSVDWYSDGTESKDVSTFEFQKFATTWVALDATVTDLVDHTQDQIK